MLNATVRAAASGLSSTLFDRRRMLLGLAAASTAAATPVAVVASAPAENATLLRLAGKTGALAQAYRDTEAARAAIVAEWEPQWPSVPKEIETRHESGEVAYDLEGLWPAKFTKYRTAAELRKSAAEYRTPRQYRKGTSARTIAKDAVWWEKLAQRTEAEAVLSEMYCAERVRIREACGIIPARAKEQAARAAFIGHVASVMEIDPVTMSGVIIQAEALEAFRAVPALHRGEFSMEMLKALPEWGERLAASILRIASAA